MKNCVIHNIELSKTGIGLSGGEKCLVELIKYLSNYYPNIIYVPENGKVTYESNGLVNNNIVYKIIGSFSVEKRFGVFISYLVRTLKGLLNIPKLNINRKHVIISHSDFWPTVIYTFFIKLKNPHVKWIALIHMLSPSIFKGFEGQYTSKYRIPSLRLVHYWLNQRLFFFLARKADFLVGVNPTYYNVLKKYNKNVRIIRYGSDVNEIKEKLITMVPSSIKEYDACFVGRFHPQKGIFELCDIWKKVTKKIPDAKLVIIGDYNNSLGIRLKTIIRKEMLDKNIILLGYKDGLEKYKVILKSKIFLFPSYYESFGIVALEAMSCGLPVVAYDLPIFRDLFRKGMVKVPILNNNSFADVIVKLLINRSYYEKIAKEASEFSKNFSWRKTGENINRIILNLFKVKINEKGKKRV